MKTFKEFISECELVEGKVPFNDPKNPGRSGHTPREKIEAKMKRTGVENPNNDSFDKGGPSERDYERYGGMKIALDKMDKKEKESKGLFGKKDKAKPHKFLPAGYKSVDYARRTIARLKGKRNVPKFDETTTTLGQVRRALGTEDEDRNYQSPINVGDSRRRTKTRWGGPNPGEARKARIVKDPQTGKWSKK